MTGGQSLAREFARPARSNNPRGHRTCLSLVARTPQSPHNKRDEEGDEPSHADWERDHGRQQWRQPFPTRLVESVVLQSQEARLAIRQQLERALVVGITIPRDVRAAKGDDEPWAGMSETAE